MEILLVIAAINTILLYCICHKWTTFSKDFCMFCLFFWVSVLEIGGMALRDFIYNDIEMDFLSTFGNLMLLVVFTNIMYFYVKHLHE